MAERKRTAQLPGTGREITITYRTPDGRLWKKGEGTLRKVDTKLPNWTFDLVPVEATDE